MVMIYLDSKYNESIKIANETENLVNDTVAFFPQPFGIVPPTDHVTLWSYFKKSPEVVACVTAIVEDILSDGWYLQPREKGSGKQKINKANAFLSRNLAKQLFTSFLFDTLVTGDGYLYKVKASKEQIKTMLNSIIKKLPFEVKSYASEYLISSIEEELKAEGDSLYQTRNVRLLPSSTIKIRYDRHGSILKYVQRVGSRIVELEPWEVVHFAPTIIDGQVYGFTPLSALFRELDILYNVKDYEKNLFEKGGVPPYMFILPEETPDSPTVKLFKKQLQIYMQIQQKWKSMILTGKVDVKELNNVKDMQFSDLARFTAQTIVMAWGIPSSRLSDFLQTKGIKGSDTSLEGYYRKISHYQDLFEDLINENLLSEFGVDLRFNRTYKQDEIREAQISMFAADTASKKQALLQGYGKAMTEEALLREIGLNEDEVQDKILENSQFPNDRQGQMNNPSMMSPENKVENNKKRKQTQLEKV
jgi:phage portal protein BeeE